ncbi:aldose 1-epimerase [Mesorhizobium sp. M7A.F.Ca.US.001.02.1.1]|uniref:aldose 1-epimerase n=1 Tax=Mesorhizobium sp. M7A.F.Ca.US.001.02.1.1 TaxID=2496703 RepID=UPI000FD5CA36|nr:aldose 1-epimerase [Mesorhizobium sp. M7A.F.Ca.US.001.02.1.1]RVA02747.1 aldose 1-epimerase [Mesorhizobium sp. M7A.F.Ca.US.001.02.1.1]
MSAGILLESNRLFVEISPSGSAIVNGHTADGVPFLRPYQGEAEFDVVHCACFPMVPIGNRVEGNAFSCGGQNFTLAPNTTDPFYIHGDGWQANWKVEEHRVDRLDLAFDHPRRVDSPYVYHARQSFRLAGARLELRLAVENTGVIPLPFGLGFHPFFPRRPRTTLFAPAETWWTERDGHLPASRSAIADDVAFSTPRHLPDRWLNNGFEGWSGIARIIWPEHCLGIDIEADAELDRYMLFAPDTDRSFFCLEPMSHTPNALKHFDADPMGIKVLSPGEVLRARFAMTVFDWSDNHG